MQSVKLYPGLPNPEATPVPRLSDLQQCSCFRKAGISQVVSKEIYMNTRRAQTHAPPKKDCLCFTRLHHVTMTERARKEAPTISTSCSLRELADRARLNPPQYDTLLHMKKTETQRCLYGPQDSPTSQCIHLRGKPLDMSSINPSTLSPSARRLWALPSSLSVAHLLFKIRSLKPRSESSFPASRFIL